MAFAFLEQISTGFSAICRIPLAMLAPVLAFLLISIGVFWRRPKRRPAGSDLLFSQGEKG
jgi:hypothetical protein